MKILVADDDSILRILMQRTLQKFGYEVVLAENGRTAAEILMRSDGPRLALVDWMMPELDGAGLCRKLRSSHREDDGYIYIVLTTTKRSTADIVAGLEAGADDYITKPCQPGELKARLHTGCRILSLEEKLVQAREQMRYRATHDALTSIWNRASILSLLQSELERSVRESKSTSVLLCDVDHFKQVNDNHGHLIGDIVLQEVAKRLTSIVRSYDAVGRYGGEEFLVFLSHCDESNLKARSEEIRAGVADTPIVAGSEELSISVSVGAVACQRWDPRLSIERILARADIALYRAKADGRNRTAIADMLTPA
ncbi:diguanylate cyclase [Acidobacterium sp. S8]|uniref:GGDEF domain-containing response regulator n=1 Tax=Acidobacterium sp. S8 TaxID=1641854 RepID=UPI00131AA42E|nr:diguanylate cyclase [Acidobacterium sp. S8]